MRERVFVAANIVDGDLVRRAWGDGILELVERIGVQRCFVSVYGGPTDALMDLDRRLEEVGVERRIVSEEVEGVDLGAMEKTKLPSGKERVERIAFLAEVRNMALRPLKEKGARRWDKVLFVNDVFFDVEGALRLLWGSDGNENEKERKKETRAVCATDFIAPWKYYDTFATRDTEGYSLGVPIFPWFAKVGNAISRNDVLAGRDRVRVKSCWGGMVVFDGSLFQSPQTSEAIPPSSENKGVQLRLRFRSEREPFWDSSECCLIHADIIAASQSSSSDQDHEAAEDPWDTGIYMNPFVRVSYSARTKKWIWLAKRFEALLPLLQDIINRLAHMPRFNPRRAEVPGQIIPSRLWISSVSGKSEEEQFRIAEESWNHGIGIGDEEGKLGFRESRIVIPREKEKEKKALVGKVHDKSYWEKEGYYIPFNRTARRGGYCGVRQLLVLKEGPKEDGDGGGNWDTLLGEIPPLDLDGGER